MNIVPIIVKACAESIGPYLGADVAYFTRGGEQVDELPADGGYIVTGNYSGSAVLEVSGANISIRAIQLGRA